MDQTEAADRVALDDWAVIGPESGGADQGKAWVAARADATRADHWLWKPCQPADDGSVLALSDVAEVVASELARRIELPTAECRYAIRDGIPGAISRNAAPSGFDLHNGDAFLDEVEGYRRGTPQFGPDGRAHGLRRLDSGYTLEAVQQVLQGLSGPPGGWEHLAAFEVFAGFLVLDALIANTDRHPRNWALLVRHEDERRFLAPAFDHGSALGSGMSDDKRRARSPEAFARKGLAHPFGPRKQTLVALAHEAIRLSGNEFWLQRVDSLTDDDLQATMEESSGKLSDAASNFMAKVLQVNRRRLCDVDDGQD